MHSSLLRLGPHDGFCEIHLPVHTCPNSAGSKLKGLHPPRKLAAKTTWLWGLVGKQGTEASPRDTDSSHRHGGACHCLSSPVIAQPGNHSVSQCRLLRLQTLCRKATRAFQLAALLSPEERSKQSRGPNENLHRCSGYTTLPRPLPIEFFMTVVSPSAEQLPRIGPRPGRETQPRRVQCACVCVCTKWAPNKSCLRI